MTHSSPGSHRNGAGGFIVSVCPCRTPMWYMNPPLPRDMKDITFLVRDFIRPLDTLHNPVRYRSHLSLWAEHITWRTFNDLVYATRSLVLERRRSSEERMISLAFVNRVTPSVPRFAMPIMCCTCWVERELSGKATVLLLALLFETSSVLLRAPQAVRFLVPTFALFRWPVAKWSSQSFLFDELERDNRNYSVSGEHRLFRTVFQRFRMRYRSWSAFVSLGQC